VERRVALSLLVSLAAMSLCWGQAPPQAAPQAAPVVVAPVKHQVVRATIELVGTVLAETESGVCSEVSGLVQKIAVKQGQRVDKGDLLCKLKDTDLHLQYREAAARLESLRQRLAELEAGTRREQIDRLRALYEEAKAIKEKWDREKQRMERLFEEKVASLKEYRDTMADWRAATFRLAATKAELEEAIAGPRKEEIARARADVEAQQAIVDQIKDKIEKTSIRAPFKGYVTAKHTEVGEWVSTGGLIVNLIDLETVLVRVNVPESAISFVRIEDPAEVRIDALDTQVSGKVVHIIPQGDQAARTFPVEIRVPNAKGTLKAGMFARAKLPAGPEMQALTVPKDAIVRQGPMRMVYTLKMGRALPVMVQTGLEERDQVAVYGELKAGDLVVVRGNERLQPGMPVTAMGPDGKPIEQTEPDGATGAEKPSGPGASAKEAGG